MFQTTIPTKVIDFTVDGECSNCGNCCSNLLPMSEEDVRTIKEYVQKHRMKPSHNGIPLNATVDMTCPFLDMSKEHKCRIYHIRPLICRFFYCNKKPTLEEVKLMVGWDIVNVRNTFFRSNSQRGEPERTK